MGVLKTLWGLLFDDARLAIGLIITLLVAAGVAYAHYVCAAAWVFWAGVVISLWVSLEHALRKKLRS